VASIDCSTDGSPYQPHPSSSALIPVQGIGQHRIVCRATNHAIDYQGSPASSQAEAWTLTIRQPSVAALAFTRIMDKVRCRLVHVYEKIPAHWVTVHRHGKPVQVKRPARTVKLLQRWCRPRVVTRKICSGGHCRKQQFVILPHAVQQSTWRARFGKGAVVSGWVGTASGAALGGQQVQVLTAPDNGSNAFMQAAAVTTNAGGLWSARLPPGPSRLVEAAYAGSSTVEPATSAQVKLIVPAKVSIHISPRSTRWGGKITITGRVLGGYIPAGKLLRLRIGVAGVRGTVGIPNLRPDGRFRTTWRFSSGSGVVHYWFSVSTLNESDYPYAPASSRRVYVRVGPG
jgi:hypothetical protein